VEITEECYRRKFKELREAYWEIQLEIPEEYDFGLILMDFKPAKEKIC